MLGQSHPASRASFEESKQLAEKWTKMINFYLKVAPAWMLVPKLILNCYFYFYVEKDSENNSFDLPFPMW